MTFTLDGFAYCCALVLGAIFVVSAGGKLAWPADTRANFARLGLPAPAALAVAVPVAELVAGILLFAYPVAGGALALVLLGAFTAALVQLLRRGVDAPCGCLGSPRATVPLTWRSVVRNGGLAALALAALLATPNLPSAPEMAAVAIVVVAAWLAFHAGQPDPRRRPSITR